VYIQLVIFYLMLGIECLLLIPFIINSGKLDRGGKLIFIYLVTNIFSAVGSIIIAYLWRNNLWFYNTMYFLQFIILSGYFYEVIKQPLMKQLIIGMVPVVLLVVAADYLWIEGPNAYNSFATSTETFIQMTYGVIFFLQLLRDEDLVKRSIFINMLPDFWFNAALFVYNCGYFLFSLSYNVRLFKGGSELIKSSSDTILAITYIAVIIQLILFYIGLLKTKRNLP
jgi:hypothetical protein